MPGVRLRKTISPRWPLPATVDYRLPAGADDWGEELAATPLVQTGDPEIRRTAEQVIGSENDPARAAERLVRWVYDNLDKEITLSVNDAVVAAVKSPGLLAEQGSGPQ